jgi:hypothetical protein
MIGATLRQDIRRPVVSGYFHLTPGDLRSWELHFMPAWIIGARDAGVHEGQHYRGVYAFEPTQWYTRLTARIYHYDQSVTIHEGLTERYWLPDLNSRCLNAPGNGIAVGAGMHYGAVALACLSNRFRGNLWFGLRLHINGYMNHCSKQWWSMFPFHYAG